MKGVGSFTLGRKKTNDRSSNLSRRIANDGINGAGDTEKTVGNAANGKSDILISMNYSPGTRLKDELSPGYGRRRRMTLLAKGRRIIIIIGCIFVISQLTLFIWNRVDLQESGIRPDKIHKLRKTEDLESDAVARGGHQSTDNLSMNRFEPEFSRHDVQNASAAHYTQLMPKQCRRVQFPREVFSAVERASSLECRKELLNVACRNKRGVLYPRVLKSSCPLMGSNTGEYIGCFRDDKSERILADHRIEFHEANSPLYCINHCLRTGFPYAGVQYTYECFCGMSLSDETHRLSSNECYSICPGDHAKKCGSYLTMDIYHTGFRVRVPQHAVYIQPSKSSGRSESSVRIVFVLTVNGRAVRQVRRLLNAIYRPHHFYFIHVDKRQRYLFRELSRITEALPNVRMSEERFSSIWGGASLLTMLLSCMEQLLAMSDWNWDYFLNLSESDYPIKSIEELEVFLEHNVGKNFVKSHGKDTPKFLRKQGLNMLFHECDNRMWRLGPRDLQDGIRVDGGSDWICLYRNFTQYLIQSHSEFLHGLKAFWAYTLLPAESFFHTALQNSEFCNTVINNNLHVTNWRRKQGCKCQYKHIVDWCGCSPNDFLVEDFNKLQNMQGKPTYFGRKFEAIINQEIINKIDTDILKSGKPDDSFWLNEYHHSDGNSSTADVILSHYLSLARSSLNHLTHGQASVHEDCQMNFLHLLEGTIYKHRDVFQGLIVTYQFEEVLHNSRRIVHTLEALYQPVPMFRIIGDTQYPQRLSYVEVGNGYDPKEELFRNYAGIISPLSDVIIKFVWHPGAPVTLTVILTDPTGVPAGSYEISAPESSTISVHTHQVDLAQPMLPGWWNVKLFMQWTLVAEYKYLVMPVSHTRGRQMGNEMSVKLHSGPGRPYHTSHRDGEYLRSLLRLDEASVEAAREVAEENSKRKGQELLDWIDELVSRKWMAAEICVVGEVKSARTEVSLCRAKAMSVESCQQTSWSTKYPDPKSEILNKDTKKFDDR